MRRAIVFSSGYVFTLREAEVMKAIAVANGVPADAIVLEERAAEHLRERREYLTHSRAARLAAHPAGQLAVSHAARDDDMAQGRAGGRGRADAAEPKPVLLCMTRGASLEQIRGLLQEYVAIIAYKLRGWA